VQQIFYNFTSTGRSGAAAVALRGEANRRPDPANIRSTERITTLTRSYKRPPRKNQLYPRDIPWHSFRGILQDAQACILGSKEKSLATGVDLP